LFLAASGGWHANATCRLREDVMRLERACGAVVIPIILGLPGIGVAGTVGNPLCPGEEVSFNPSSGEDIVVPDGFKVSVFASGLNFPTGIALRGSSKRFEVYVLE